MMLNQCDGCARGLPLSGGIHRGPNYDLIGCTAHRYLTHGEQRDYREVKITGPIREYVVDEVTHRLPAWWVFSFVSERWCSTCRAWFLVNGIMGELRFMVNHPKEGHK